MSNLLATAKQTSQGDRPVAYAVFALAESFFEVTALIYGLLVAVYFLFSPHFAREIYLLLTTTKAIYWLALWPLLCSWVMWKDRPGKMTVIPPGAAAPAVPLFNAPPVKGGVYGKASTAEDAAIDAALAGHKGGFTSMFEE